MEENGIKIQYFLMLRASFIRGARHLHEPGIFIFNLEFQFEIWIFNLGSGVFI